MAVIILMDIIISVVNYLESRYLDNSNIDNYTPTYFHTLKVPEISIFSYLIRLKTFCKLSDTCLVSSLIYIDRLRAIANKHTIHRLILTAVLLSSKFLEDASLVNSVCAEVGLSLIHI